MKLSKFIAVSCLSLALVACGQNNVSAQPASKKTNGDTKVEVVKTSSDAKLAEIKATVEKLYQDQKLEVLSVQDTPIAGWFEVVVSGNQIIYIEEKGRYMMVGDIIDMNSKMSLTQERSKELNKVEFDSLPFDQAIKEVRGNGELKVAVFTDPKCPYCHKLEKEFEKMTNVTIYNFMLPFQPGADQLAESLWCQTDKTKAWVDWMRKGVTPSNKTCPHPIAQTAALGQKMGFSGTPAIIFPNGKVQPGYMPQPQLEEAIRNNQK